MMNATMFRVVLLTGAAACESPRLRDEPIEPDAPVTVDAARPTPRPSRDSGGAAMAMPAAGAPGQSEVEGREPIDARASGSSKAEADAGGADTATDGSAVAVVGTGPPCKGGELVCDDFEGSALGQIPGKWRRAIDKSGTAVIDGKHAHGGKRSVMFSGDGVYVGLSPSGWTTPKGSELYGRMMLYFESMPAGSSPAHFALVRGETGFLTWARFGGNNHSDGNSTFDATYYGRCDVGVTTGTKIPKNRWFCYEWAWNRTTHAWSLWVDGVPVRGLHFTKTTTAGACWSVPPIDRISIGWQQDHRTTGPLAMWVDDVSLAERRIGCPAPGGH